MLGVDESRIQVLANGVIHEQHHAVSRLARQQRAVSGARTLRLGAAGCRALEDHLRLGGAWCDAVDGHVAEAARAEVRRDVVDVWVARDDGGAARPQLGDEREQLLVDGVVAAQGRAAPLGRAERAVKVKQQRRRTQRRRII